MLYIVIHLYINCQCYFAQATLSIKYFFEHYKGLEKGKWVKISGWEDAAAAKAEIVASVKRLK
jgi:inorganic pyrophosphatase